MKLSRYSLRNFRRLEDVTISLESGETVFVGPNNSAKTSATAAFRLLVAQTQTIRIHDFSAPLIRLFDAYQIAGQPVEALPSIEIDLWFEIDPSTEYGRIASLLSSISLVHDEIGLRISFSNDDIQGLVDAYRIAYPLQPFGETSKSGKSLSHFLSEGGHLLRHFSFKYYSLECNVTPFDPGAVHVGLLDKDFGRSALSSLLRVDFVEAHRNIDDLETPRSNRLSSVFADFYRSNLDQPEIDAAAHAVINESNDKLTAHYGKQFQPLFGIIGRLGFPSINDRNLRIVSSLSPVVAMRGSTTLQYEELASGHQLPESYNGLGFKNMIFMAIQITHFQKQWINTKSDQALCQVIFIEEPEVHLHAQVQQAFIRQVSDIITMTAEQHSAPDKKPQLVITTHSSHILDEVDFTNVRYFRRVRSRYTKPDKEGPAPIKVASEVLSLRDFKPVPLTSQTELSAGELAKAATDALGFLKKYLSLTHCDLFFSDAAILIEGTVERLLLPSFIQRGFLGLKSAYLTVLEIGGAYAHVFIPLVDFIGLPTLVITDLDAVDPKANRRACRADTPDAETSNTTLKEVFGHKLVTDLLALKAEDRAKVVQGNPLFIAFQTAVEVAGYTGCTTMIPRTFEESFIYTNLPAVRHCKLETFTPLGSVLDYEADYSSVFEAVKSKGYKKVEFALNQMVSTHPWVTPAYICDGLKWLDKVLTPLPSGTA